jgi:UDP-4-amino-4,6-dideoxy-L-N-acetyl-beta-L-altrosamine transaminase
MSESPELSKNAARRVADYVAAFVNDPAAFRGQQLRGTGPVREFERLLADRSGFPFCVAMSNATTALLVAAIAADVSGKEVICPPNTWRATFGVLEFAGAKVIRAEADEVGNICPRSVERLMSPETAAVVAADWHGHRHQSRSIRAICRSGCLYIEDTSFLPVRLINEQQPSLADVQVISFGPGKPVSLAEGGALLTTSEAIYRKAVALSQHPERCAAEGINEMPRHQFLNGRMHPIAALIGVALLEDRFAE